MSENRISLLLSDADKAAINAAINTLVTLLQPKLIALSFEDKKRLPKIGDDALPFQEKVAQYVVSNPEFIPMFADVEEFQKDFSTFKDLQGFLRLLQQIIGNMDDTAMLAGVEADDFARRYYGAVGQAAKMGVPNAQAIYDDLSTRYEAQRARRPKPAPPAAQT